MRYEIRGEFISHAVGGLFQNRTPEQNELDMKEVKGIVVKGQAKAQSPNKRKLLVAARP